MFKHSYWHWITCYQDVVLLFSIYYIGSYQLCCILTKWKTIGFWRYVRKTHTVCLSATFLISLLPLPPLPPSPSSHTGSDGLIQLWDIGSGNIVREFKGHSEVTSLAYSPDGTLLASSCHGNQIRVWNMRTANVLPVASIGLGVRVWSSVGNARI